MSFGKLLRRYRVLLNFSQSNLSKITEIPQTTLSDFENDKYLPDVKQAFRIAKALGCNVTDLLEGEEEHQPA